MNTLRTVARWISLPVFAFCLLALPAQAQKSNSSVTIQKTNGDETIVVKIKDGERTVTVNGEVLDDDEAEEFLEKMDMMWVEHDDGFGWQVGPKGHRFRFFGDNDDEFLADFHARMKEEWPRTYSLSDDDGKNHVFVLDDQLRSLKDGLTAFGGAELGFDFNAMAERTEIARLDMASRRLAMKIREASVDEKADLERELRDQLEEIFDQKEALRAKRVDALREKLDEVMQDQQQRQQNRQEIIEHRMKELLGERDKYDW